LTHGNLMFDPKRPFDLPLLMRGSVPMGEWESTSVLRACIQANKALAALKEAAALLPNPDVMLSSLVLLESKASSEIENIVTTTDELFQYAAKDPARADLAVKETLQYRESLYHGLDQLRTRPLATTLIEEICSKTKGMEMRVRKVPGTALVNARTQETIYTPPQGEALLREKLADWERFCHAEETDAARAGDIDPLVRMAVLHYQFEAIHPFLDGNGRTGRVLNLLYLVDKGLLTSPVLYLSRYILNHRSRYYALLLAVSREGSVEAWQQWLLYMLEAVRETAVWTLEKIKAISRLMQNTHEQIQRDTKLGNQKGLVELIFRLPYCRAADVVQAQIAKRQTAAVYLQTLVTTGLLQMQGNGREKLYLNHRLIDLLKNEDADGDVA
jgi:Fic family protein